MILLLMDLQLFKKLASVLTLEDRQYLYQDQKI